MKPGRVAFEGWFQPSTAAYARFGRMIVDRRVELLSVYQMPFDGCVVVLIGCAPEHAEEIARAARLHEVKWRSPTVFNFGSLEPMYASPEDELADRKTEAAKAALARQDGDV